MSFFRAVFPNLLLAFITSFFVTGLIIKMIQSNQSKPKGFGGTSIFIGFWLGFFTLFPELFPESSQVWLFFASAVVLLTGLLDDYYDLSPLQKSFGIFLAGNIVYFLTDIHFSSIMISNIPSWLFNISTYLLTIMWIYFVTNAFNLLDGLDGLASSVSITSLTTLVMMTYYSSLTIRLTYIAMLLLLVSAILGFLPFNWYPAKIYLGDTGSLFIGFMFATLTVYNLKNVSIFTLIVPLFFYAVPLFDTSYTIIRRLYKGHSLIEKDEEHLHHRLLKLGLSVPQVVKIMVALTIMFSLIGIIAQIFSQFKYIIMIIAIILVVLLSYFMVYIDKNH